MGVNGRERLLCLKIIVYGWSMLGEEIFVGLNEEENVREKFMK
jgi:hypothetical protein